MPRLFELLSDDKQKEVRKKIFKKNSSQNKYQHSGQKRRSNISKSKGNDIYIPDFVAVDCETTGLNARSDSIIEVGAVRFIRGKPVEEFSSLVNPKKNIPAEITRLTGITDNDVAGAPEFSEIADKFADFLGDLPMCGHQIEFDANFINEELKRIGKDRKKFSLLDTAVLSRTLLPDSSGYSLVQVAEDLSISLVSAHRALDDARASGEVAVILLKKLKEIPSDVRSRMAAFCPGSLLKYLLNKSITAIENKKTYNKKKYIDNLNKLELPEDCNPVDKEEIEEIFSENGNLSKMINEYSPRESQISMAKDITKALNNKTFIVAEAGTGVGKTLAYLIPSSVWAFNNNTRVLISTRTRNLQDQIIKKDLPLLSKMLGDSFRYSVLKGRSNYLCLNRWNRLLSGQLGNLSPRERFGVLPLIIWAEQTTNGDIEDQNQFNRRWFSKVWNLISSDSGECLGRRCPHFNACFLQNARRKSLSSNIVVINHSLFFSEVCSESSFLGTVGPIVFDEAHHLEASGYQHLKTELDTNRISRYTETLENLLKNITNNSEKNNSNNIVNLKSTLKRFRKISKSFLKDCEKWVLDNNEVKSDIYQYRYEADSVSKISGLVPFKSIIEEIQNTIVDIKKSNDGLTKKTDDLMSDITSCLEKTSQLKADVIYLTNGITDDHVFWVEGNMAKGWLKLCGVPLDIGGIIAERWETHDNALVFTSATLSVSESLEYFKRKVGLIGLNSDRTDNKIYHSPFVEEQMLKYVLNSNVTPNDINYHEYVAENILRLLQNFKKNILVLFTSNSMMDLTYKALNKSPSLPEKVTVLSQSASSSRHLLLKQFRQASWAVLFGTDSFWEGIDIPGKGCEIVVIPRLPFQVPTHPLTQAIAKRHEEIDGESFMSYSVPEAVIRFRQGAGRLIRTTEDLGLLLVLDTRIVTKGYGRKFIKSIDGEFKITDSIDNVITDTKKFFGE